MRFKRTRVLTVSGALLVLLSVLTACGGTTTGTGGTNPTATAGKKIKVGLVTDIGGLNDNGFNHSAYLGLQQAEQQLGIQGDVTQSVTGNDYVPNLTNYATKGYDMVIAVGFLMSAAVGTVSGQFPNVHFAIIDSQGTDANGNDLHHPNVLSLLFKENEAGALVGVIAGTLEKDGADPKKANNISAVGGISIPPVDRYIAGYKWAAQMADPGIKVQVGYSNDFADTTKCAGVANSQIAAGADIVFQVAGGCGLGALKAAGQKGVYSIGVDTDQKSSDPSVIASALKKVDVATFDAIQFIAKGTLPTGYNSGVTPSETCTAGSGQCPEFLFSLANGGVGYAPGNISLPADVTAAEQNLESQIKSGAVTPPTAIP
jgi:basic membrane protein A and related proteins